MLFDVRCPGCGIRGWSPCPDCIDRLDPPLPASVPGATSVHCLFAHERVGRRLVHALKFGSDRTIARWLGASLARSTKGLGIEVVTWAPTTSRRRRRRGFDQSRRLAKVVARELGVPCRGLLRRSGEAQAGRGRAARLRSVSFTPTGAAPSSVLLIDDVITTGATLGAATHAVRRAGASRVHVAVCSRADHDELEAVSPHPSAA